MTLLSCGPCDPRAAAIDPSRSGGTRRRETRAADLAALGCASAGARSVLPSSTIGRRKDARGAARSPERGARRYDRAVDDPLRLSAAEAARRLRSDAGARLVCAYPTEVGMRKFPLPGAISLGELAALEPELAHDALIVFYCRCPDDKTALARALEWRAKGWRRASVLAGGWQAARAR
jgi:hypothetical protein